MLTFAQRFDAAIRATGKTGEEIARLAGTHKDTVSNLRSGKQDNPELQTLIRIVRVLGTTVGALLGESIRISDEDADELVRFRGWIDEKLATKDARLEPNATIVPASTTQALSDSRESRVAEGPTKLPRRIENPFDANVHLELRAIGESMTGAGILPDDTLYAIPADTVDSAVGKIVACRIDEAVFVKRLVTEHARLYLLSANPRYQSIEVNPKTFELLGTVIGRVGKIS
jgi:transcriptional regulator with XRE-family HTH domain